MQSSLSHNSTKLLTEIYKTTFWENAVQLSGLGRSDKQGIERCPLWSKPTLATTWTLALLFTQHITSQEES